MVISIFWMINGILYIPEIFHWEWYNISNRINYPVFITWWMVRLYFLTFYYIFKKRIFLYLILAFSVFETIIIVWKGFNDSFRQYHYRCGKFNLPDPVYLGYQ